MASPAQVLANRQNSTHSTGPVTAEGKARSARNATRHGLTSKQIVIPGQPAGEKAAPAVKAKAEPAKAEQHAESRGESRAESRAEAAVATVTAVDSAEGKSGGDANLTKLQGLTGKEFDKAYIDNEVAYHQTVLDAIDKTLIPNAQNADLKALLEKVRPAIQAHLDMAKKIQSTQTT